MYMETIGTPSIRDSAKKMTSQGEMPWKFFVVLILITIPFWVFGGNTLPVPFKLPVSALAAFNPMVAALIVTFMQSGSDSVKELARKIFDFKSIKNKIWYIPTLLLTPLISLCAYALMRWRDIPLPDPEIPIPMVLV